MQIREEYGVSDTVALEARKVLMAEGLVEGRSGSGTYVREHPAAPPDRPRRLPAAGGVDARSGRSRQTSDVQGTWESSSEQVDAPRRRWRSGCGIEPGSRVMRTRYVYRADGDPVMTLDLLGAAGADRRARP